jgi:hypothetical protein
LKEREGNEMERVKNGKEWNGRGRQPRRQKNTMKGVAGKWENHNYDLMGMDDPANINAYLPNTNASANTYIPIIN